MRTRHLLLLLLLVVPVAMVTGKATGQEQKLSDNEVTDGQQTDERDNASVAQIAVIVTIVACVIASILCIGACGFCCYQKCIVEGCSI